jgi:hypothetical protein
MAKTSELFNQIVETAELVRTGDGADEYQLDLSEESIARLDDMIDDFWGEGGPAEENFHAMVWAFGCYIGAVVTRHFKGEWFKDETTGEVTFESDTSGVGFNPFNWVAKKFDLQDDLESKYRMITNMIEADRR